ncbi:stalk domain-containing protein [Ammoniphilus sp. CFH 90114]|uniref:stalk domain-containing protein n=1 Tax=Ammoniphilus sp. CFH 90114 TaxID=2493665 RepID=UPI00100F2266|nr:stalk domain-containing protein [Ammoniphilus sp. CFH 90114]RXT04364.1 hypothetical protein EIZ39_21035 [Ammoniphilus sp. CFH 90114]
MMEKIKIVLLCLVLGGGIGLFPLLTEEKATTTIIGAQASQEEKSMKIELDKRQVWVNDQWVPGDVFLLDGRTYIPTRSLEAWGAEIRYDSNGRLVEIKMR